MTKPQAAIRALEQAIERYEAQGYEVTPDEHLPPPLQDFAADAVARRNEKHVVIEVRSADMTDQSKNRLARLADILAINEGWQIDIVTYAPESTPGAPRTEDIVRRVNEARLVADTSPEAAVLLTWSAIEGSLLRLSQERGISTSHSPQPRGLIRELTIHGVLSLNQSSELDNFARLRNEIAHGSSADLPEPEQLQWLAQFALDAAANEQANVEDMIDWFLAHYTTPEDAALFYNKDEGDYVWVGTGPHDAREVLYQQFENALESDIEEAAQVVERDSFWWADIEKIRNV